MPYKSMAQERWAHTANGMKALGGKGKVDEWDSASKGLHLPTYKAYEGGKVPEEKEVMQESHRMAKSAALKKLMDLMDEHGVHDLKGLKGKPVAAEMSITKVEPMKKMSPKEDEPFVFGRSWDKDEPESMEEEMKEDHADDMSDDDEPSAEEKEMIAQKYHKYFGKK